MPKIKKKSGSGTHFFTSEELKLKEDKIREGEGRQDKCIDVALQGAGYPAADLMSAFGGIRLKDSDNTVVGLSDILQQILKKNSASASADAVVGGAGAAMVKKRPRRDDEAMSELPSDIDEDYMTHVVTKLSRERLAFDNNPADAIVTLAIPNSSLNAHDSLCKEVLRLATERYKKGHSTYIVVPVLSKRTWSVASLYVKPAICSGGSDPDVGPCLAVALRLYGSPAWKRNEENKYDDVTTSLFKLFLAEYGVLPPKPDLVLRKDVNDMSRSMFLTNVADQKTTGASVIAMLMSQIGIYINDVLMRPVCDICQRKLPELKAGIDAYVRESTVLAVKRVRKDEDDRLKKRSAADPRGSDEVKQDDNDLHSPVSPASPASPAKKSPGRPAKKQQGLGGASLTALSSEPIITFKNGSRESIPVTQAGEPALYYPVVVTDVRGDGNCFYYALYQALANSGALVDFKTRLSECYRIDISTEENFSASLRVAIATEFITKDKTVYENFLDNYMNHRQTYDTVLKTQPVWLRSALTKKTSRLSVDTYITPEEFEAIIQGGFTDNGNFVAQLEITTLESMLERCNVPILIAKYNHSSVPPSALKTILGKTVVNLLNISEGHWKYLQFGNTDAGGLPYQDKQIIGAILGYELRGVPHKVVSSGGVHKLRSRLHRYVSLS